MTTVWPSPTSRSLGPESRGYRLAWNFGPDTNQKIAHPHLHLLPEQNELTDRLGEAERIPQHTAEPRPRITWDGVLLSLRVDGPDGTASATVVAGPVRDALRERS